MQGLFFKYEGYKFFLEGDGDYEFDDCRHLYGFLNYLYRTDEAQKWTNEMTQKKRGFLVPNYHCDFETREKRRNAHT